MKTKKKKSAKAKSKPIKKPGVHLGPKKHAEKILKRLAGLKIDKAGKKTVKKFAEVKRSQLTVGSVQSSFHAAERTSSHKTYKGQFPIVAVGASAGGIESFTELLTNVPVDTGMAFVLIQHLAPHHDSLLPAIISRVTKMRVELGVNDLRVKPNHVYIIPPNTNMGILQGALKLLPRIEGPGQHMPIDFFFRCLADDQTHLGIGVVLSGADGDGAQGLRAMRAQGGLTLVQDPRTAKVDGMPRNAIAAGGTDTILSVPEIAAELARVSRHPLAQALDDEPVSSRAELTRMFTILKSQTGVDFSKYKLGTMNRRLRRRILLHKVEKLSEYLQILEQDRNEVAALYDDLLINVTSFFRDPDVFEALRTKLFPKLLKRFEGDGPVRIWVPGCATGEEAYSIAIAFIETMEAEGKNVKIQIFASDISEKSLVKAREALYSESIHVDVSMERLRKYFVKSSGGYRIAPAIRELCVFARQDLLRDPPFSRMDFISCRNLMIYLEQDQQKRIINLFSYALNSNSYLLLGSSETAGPSEGFDLVDKHVKLFVRKSLPGRPHVDLPMAPNLIQLPILKPLQKMTDAGLELEREATRLLLERFSPGGVIIDSQMQILQIRGRTGDFLEAAQGDASFNLFKMARAGLDTELRILMKKVEKSDRAQTKRDVSITNSGSVVVITLEIIPIHVHENIYYLVLFVDERSNGGKGESKFSRKSRKGLPRASVAREVQRVREELQASKEHLQSIIREQDLSNEELQAANEEILSSNEELQSTNEELETAKEELQSANEELITVNDELNDRNTQMLIANNDLNNLLASVDLPIIMVGNDLRIRRYTPLAEKVLNVIPSDIGRPITDIKPNIEVADLDKLILSTIDTMQNVERSVQDRSGHWYSLRIRPYRTDKNKIDGAVVILLEIGEGQLATHDYSASDDIDSIDSIDQPVLFLNQKLEILRANKSYLQMFQSPVSDTVGRSLFETLDGSWSQPMLKALINDVVAKGTQLSGYKIERTFPHVGKKSMVISVRCFRQDGSLRVWFMIDESERK